MMREVVGTITGILLALYLSYWFIPMVYQSHINFANVFNATDPVISQSYTLGLGFYQIALLVPIFVGAFVIISVALKGGSTD